MSQLKSIMYLSSSSSGDANVPAGLSEILRKSEKLNKQHNIGGFLVYKDGYFMQVLEGEEDVVDNLYEKIQSDSRHYDVITFLETPVASRMFPNFGMRLVVDLTKKPQCGYYFRRYAHVLNKLQKSHKKLLSNFYDLHSVEHIADVSDTSQSNSSKFKDKKFRLKKWPDFSNIQENFTLIEISAKLLKHDTHYDDLFKGSGLATEKELDAILLELDKQKILRSTVDIREQAEVISIDSADKDNNKNKFYGLMKNFLKLGS